MIPRIKSLSIGTLLILSGIGSSVLPNVLLIVMSSVVFDAAIVSNSAIAAPSLDSRRDSEPPEDSRSDRNPWQVIKAHSQPGMAYADFREFALSHGWEALIDPECRSNVGGTAQVCQTRPETSACSGDGFCVVNFRHRWKPVAIKVGTYGDQIRYTEFSRVPERSQSTPAASCPSQDFTSFLAAYASDPKVRNQFTASFIRVEQLVDDEQGFRTKSVLVPKAAYQDFTLTYRDGSFYHVLPGEDLPLTVSTRLQPKSGRLNIIKRGDNYFVKSLIGVSEGNSWLFKRSSGCWVLSEDPEAPSP